MRDYDLQITVQQLNLQKFRKFYKVNKEYYGNINSIHGFGTKAKVLYDEAIKQICEIIKINKDELIITSGATESNNMALVVLHLQS